MITSNGGAGANSLTFAGKIGGRTLGAGSYRLTATPAFNGVAGQPRTTSFAIAR